MPGPVFSIAGIFSGDGIGEPDAGEVFASICLPKGFEALKTGVEHGNEASGETGGAVFVSFAAADGDEAGAEINVTDAEAQAFVEAEAAAEHELGDE